MFFLLLYAAKAWGEELRIPLADPQLADNGNEDNEE